MPEWLRNLWRKVTTKPCDGCGEPVPINAYRKTGRSRNGKWWAGDEVELECPNCAETFWVKK
jgi:hypothetical protein